MVEANDYPKPEASSLFKSDAAGWAYEIFDMDYVRSVFLEYRKAKALEEQETQVPSDGDNLAANSDRVWEPLNTLLARHASEVQENTEPFLIKRIARANFRRRQQFSYWNKHHDKLNQYMSDFKHTPATRDKTSTAAIHRRPIALTPSVPATTALRSVTTATHLEIGRFDIVGDNTSTMSVTEYKPSDWQPAAESLTFPNPPKKQAQSGFFECPYCFTLCSTKPLAPKAWR